MPFGPNSRLSRTSYNLIIPISGSVSDSNFYHWPSYTKLRVLGGDDCHGFAETLAVIGKALLTGIHVLQTNQLFKPYDPEEGSGIRNISTVLALFVNFIRMWVDIGGDHYGETKWVSKVGKEARENGINIKGPYKFHETAEKLLKPEEENKPGEKNEVYFDDEMEIRDNGDYSIKGWKEAVCPN